MKKSTYLCIILAAVLLITGCSYSNGDPNKAIKKIEAVTTHNAVITGEPLLVRFFAVTENGKRSEILPKDIELYFDDGDINNIDVVSGNLFTFKTAGTHIISLRLMNEQSVKGKLEVQVYEPQDHKTLLSKLMSEFKDVELKEKEVTAPDKNAAEVYEILKSGGATELSFTASIDSFKYYERDTFESTLNLSYFVAVKILKDGMPVHPNNGFKLFYLDVKENKCLNIFGNASQAQGFNGVEYNSIIGDLTGEAFKNTFLTDGLDAAYATGPAGFTVSKDYSFLILSEEAGRYELFIEAILKDSPKKFSLSTLLLDSVGDDGQPHSKVITGEDE